jgi:hypothetical protein
VATGYIELLQENPKVSEFYPFGVGDPRIIDWAPMIRES